MMITNLEMATLIADAVAASGVGVWIGVQVERYRGRRRHDHHVERQLAGEGLRVQGWWNVPEETRDRLRRDAIRSCFPQTAVGNVATAQESVANVIPLPAQRRRAPSPQQPVDVSTGEAFGAMYRDDVISALTSAGFPRVKAVACVDACQAHERISIESWTVAALRRSQT
jgi:hypothetical protein